MSANRLFRSRAFTLVEMLVVLGIIAILVALLMPAVMAAVNSGRRTRMATEIAQIKDAIEKYKTDKGDYPPNFRNYSVFLRHVRRCYPKIAAMELNTFIQLVWPGRDLSNPPPDGEVGQIDEGESLVFWLSMTRNSPQTPFFTGEMVKYYDFPQQRLVPGDADVIPSFRPEFAKDTYYLYVDSRSYLTHMQNFIDPMLPPAPCSAEGMAVTNALPYWSENPVPVPPMGATLNCQLLLPMNPTTFQILCAGQDGDFGYLDAMGNAPIDAKTFPSGAYYNRGDRDNLTDFSAGRKLDDHIP